MSLNKWILFFALLLVSATAAARKYPFRKTDKGPYGTYVLYDQLQNLFPGSDISISHNAPSNKLKTVQSVTGYFVVAPFISFTEDDLATLDEFLRAGNVLVLSSYFFDDKVEDWLQVKIESGLSISDSLRIYNLDSGNYSTFHYGKYFRSYISKYDSVATDFQLLGKYKNNDVNFISFKRHSGYIVIHTQPYMFSNYHLIKKKTEAYSEVFFSSLPGPLDYIIWDEYAKSGEGSGDFAALSFILKEPPLRIAFWWALAGLLFVVFISFKRKQKHIPVITPVTNSSLDMVRTVSDMYYFSRKNEVMAKKKIAHWYEFLRVKYNIFTNQSPDIFWLSVQMRSDLNEQQITTLRNMVETYRSGEMKISDVELIHLNRLIDSFYKA